MSKQGNQQESFKLLFNSKFLIMDRYFIMNFITSSTIFKSLHKIEEQDKENIKIQFPC